MESVAPEKETILWVFLFILFYQVQNDKLLERSYFFYSILFCELANHKICQVKNSKLEMLKRLGKLFSKGIFGYC